MDTMIATAKPRVARALARKAAEVDLALSVADAPKPDAPIVSKRPRLRGRARAAVAQTIEGPTSKRPVKLAPGTKISRTYKGRKLSVLVVDDRLFEFEGRRYKSLSAIANEVTKSHVSGNAWFGLTGPKAKKSKGGAA